MCSMWGSAIAPPFAIIVIRSYVMKEPTTFQHMLYRQVTIKQLSPWFSALTTNSVSPYLIMNSQASAADALKFGVKLSEESQC